MVRAAEGVATAIASRRRPRRASVQILPATKMLLVRAERHEQHRGGEGDVVGELVAAQYELGEVHGQTERGREAQHTGGKEEQGRDQRAHESASRRKFTASATRAIRASSFAIRSIVSSASAVSPP